MDISDISDASFKPKVFRAGLELQAVHSLLLFMILLAIIGCVSPPPSISWTTFEHSQGVRLPLSLSVQKECCTHCKMLFLDLLWVRGCTLLCLSSCSWYHFALLLCLSLSNPPVGDSITQSF